MIYDHIKNIGLYKGLTPAIDTALDYIAKVTPEVENGTYLPGQWRESGYQRIHHSPGERERL